MANEIEGLVLRIERTSIHDGAGLRTVLFLKGCPLSCYWCSTPESLKPFMEKGYIPDRCNGCGVCVNSCPTQALRLVDNTLVTDVSLCKGCFDCVASCPEDALKAYGQRMTVSLALEQICKDEIFFFHSGGGVTLSGGECLLQANFSAGVLKGCRRRGINTAVETSLHAPWPEVKKILPFTDTLFVDIKHLGPSEHKKYVGVTNKLILSNLAKLDNSDLLLSLHLRIPLIPGINDSDDTLRGILSIAKKLTKLKEIEILPYHRLGVGTYSYLGRKYLLDKVPTPTNEYITERIEFLRREKANVPVKIGGGFL